ncbi:MAG: class I tRNA ligase family protein, partial [Bryobacterales bacterium]|nr:class I tRNA ligase family protein [Bryobacterales bacterium]
PATDMVPIGEQSEFDQWILVRAEALIERCRKHYADFEFHRVYQALYNFATTDLSSIYFDALKDRLYTMAPKSKGRRSAQTSLYKLTHALARLLAPILSFTTDEVWQNLAKLEGDPKSVHLALMPEPASMTSGLSDDSRARMQNWERLMPVREQVLKALEVARQEKFIGAPLEAKVRLRAGEALAPLLVEYIDHLPGLFITSQVTLEPDGDTELSVHIERADGTKCERCWKYSTLIGIEPRFPTVCDSCAAALKEIVG